MKKRFAIILLYTFVAFPGIVTGADKGDFSFEPTTNGGKPFRIGYLEGGPYFEYQQRFSAVIRALADLGWIEKMSIPEQADPEDTKALWGWLSKNASGKYIVFEETAYWSHHWAAQRREREKKTIIEKLNQKKLDMVIAMGTWAGQDLANDMHSVPTIVIGASNPLSTKIIKSVTDSGFDHVHARVDPERYKRQIRIFHDIIGFQTLGMAFEDSDEGRSYAAYTDVLGVAKEAGFKVELCQTLNHVPEVSTAKKSVVNCMHELSNKVDAVYITTQIGVTLDNFPALLSPLEKAKIPTFSQYGSDEVRHGILLSIAQADFKYIGEFNAKTIAKVFNGAKPRMLEQLFESPSKIAINLATAKIIGYDPPIDILGAADEIYVDIEKFEPR